MVFPFLSQTTDFISKFDIFVNVLKKNTNLDLYLKQWSLVSF